MKYFSLLLLMMLSLFALAQTASNDTTVSGQVNDKEPDLESIGIAFTSTSWLNTPADLMSYAPSLGFDLLYCKDYKLSGNNFTFAPGLAFSFQSAGNNGLPYYHWNTAGTSVDSTTFAIIPDSIDYITNRISQQWIQIPLEFRIRSNNNAHGKCFKVGVGGKIGYMIGNHYTHSEKDADNQISKMKLYHIRNLNPLQYGLTGRVGFGSVSLSAFYSMSTLFATNKGPAIQPLVLSLVFSLNTNP